VERNGIVELLSADAANKLGEYFGMTKQRTKQRKHSKETARTTISSVNREMQKLLPEDGGTRELVDEGDHFNPVATAESDKHYRFSDERVPSTKSSCQGTDCQA
jgi:hypothetical protein